jgi:hypothetical protein
MSFAQNNGLNHNVNIANELKMWHISSIWELD